MRLKHAREAVSGSLELDEVYRSVVEHAAQVTGATQALLTRLNARAGELRTVSSAALLPASRAALSWPGPAQVGPRTRDAGCSSAESGIADARADRAGPAPLRRAQRGRDRRRFDEAGPRAAGAAGALSAAAIANAIDFQRERRIARAADARASCRSRCRELPDYETGLLYAPALGEPTGGDRLRRSGACRAAQFAVLVGDVAGKGVETAALSAMVRFFVEARSWDADSPARVLEQTNSMMIGRLPSDTFVTAFLAVIGPALATGRRRPPAAAAPGRRGS